MNYFVGSDPHFGHANMCAAGKDYCQRPFKTLEKMNTELIRRHNERVRPGDLYFCLGDFCFHNSKAAVERGEGDLPKWEYYWNQLNGHKVLIQGNHDRSNSAKTPAKMIVLEYGGFTFGATHRPEDALVKFKELHVDFWLVGHVHNSWPKFIYVKGGYHDRHLINVSLDVWNFYPVKLEEIVSCVKKKDFKVEREINLVDYLNRGRHGNSTK